MNAFRRTDRLRPYPSSVLDRGGKDPYYREASSQRVGSSEQGAFFSSSTRRGWTTRNLTRLLSTSLLFNFLFHRSSSESKWSKLWRIPSSGATSSCSSFFACFQFDFDHESTRPDFLFSSITDFYRQISAFIVVNGLATFSNVLVKGLGFTTFVLLSLFFPCRFCLDIRWHSARCPPSLIQSTNPAPEHRSRSRYPHSLP